MAANKEALVVVLDVGPGMLVKDEDEETAFSMAKTCVELILQRKIFAESKDEIGIVLFGTSETDNVLAEGNAGEYQNISVIRNLRTVNWDILMDIKEIEEGKVDTDFIDALIVGMDMIEAQTKGKKFASFRVVLISNFTSEVSDNQLDIIAAGLKEKKMELNVISLKSFDYDNDKSKDIKTMADGLLSAEVVVQKLLQDVEGDSFTFQDALPALTYYQKKSVNSAPWNAELDIGPNFSIPITGYLKCTEYKLKNWLNCYAQDPNLTTLRATSFHLNDEAQTEIDKNNTVYAYRYGTSVIPYSEDDKKSMGYENKERGVKVLGFTKLDKIKRHYYCGDKCHYFVGSKANKEAQIALSAFIHALQETNMVAIVRYANSQRSAPRMGFLLPRIKPTYKCLVFIQLPFLEDIQHISFPSLDSNKKHIPNADQLKAVSNLMDAMDLSTAEKDEDGKGIEAFTIKDTSNPFLQRFFQCLQHRALNSKEPLPDFPDEFRNKLEAPDDLLEAAKPVIKQLKELFPLKEIVEKKEGRTGSKMFQNGKSTEDAENANKKPHLDNSNLSSTVIGTVTEVGSINPVGDFKALLSQGTIKFADACKQLEDATKRLFEDSQGGMLQNKAITCLQTYREESLKKKECVLFNQFLQYLKSWSTIKNKSVWLRILSEKIGLITKDECPTGGVPTEVAGKFMVDDVTAESDDTSKNNDEDAEDLLAEMGQ